MKYLKKFESDNLTISLKNCFEGFEDLEFDINGPNLIPIEFIQKVIIKSNNIYKMFELTNDIIDELISSIGKSKEIGFSLNQVILCSGESRFKHFRSIKELELIHLDSSDIKYFYNNLTKIEIYFNKAPYKISVL